MNYEVRLEHKRTLSYPKTLTSCVFKTEEETDLNFPCFEKEQHVEIIIHGIKHDIICLHLKASFNEPTRTDLTEDKLRHLVEVYFSKIPDEIKDEYPIEDYFEDLTLGRKIDYLDIQEEL